MLVVIAQVSSPINLAERYNWAMSNANLDLVEDL